MPREDVADPPDSTEGADDELDLSGEELYDIPPDDDEGTQAPTGTAPDSATGAPPDQAATGDKPRDQLGRFVEKGEGAPPTGQPPEAKAGQEPTPTTEPPAPAEGQEPPPEAFEFSFRADGKTIPIPGSRLAKDKLEIPAEYVPEIQRLLSYGVVYQGSYRERLAQAKREVAEARSQVHQEVEEAKAVLNVFKGLLEQGPVAVENWLDDFERNKVALEAEMKLAHARALTERKPVEPEPVDLPGAEGEAPDDFLAGVDRDQLVQTVGNHLTSSIRELVAREKIRGLAAEDLTRIQRVITEDPDELNAYFGIALEAVPEQGIEKGTILLDEPKLIKRLKYEAEILANARKGTAAAVAADKKNQSKAGANGAPIPPTTAATGSGAPKKQPVPIPTRKEDLDAYLYADD